MGEETWLELQKCIVEGNLSLSFLKEVEKQKEKVADINAILHANSNVSELVDWRQSCTDRISSLSHVQDDCSQKFSLLESVINYGKKVSEDIYSVDGIRLLSEFNKRKENWQSRKLSQLEDVEFWGPLFPLLNSAVSLKPLMSSVSFANMAKICLEESRDQNVVYKDGDEPPNDFYSLVKFLSTKVIKRLQDEWIPVFNDPGCLTVEAMKTLLKGLKRKEKLEAELGILEKCFHRRFSQDVKLYISDYVKYPSVLKQVNHVIALLDTFGLSDPKNEVVSTLKSFKMHFSSSKTPTLKALHKSMDSVESIVSACTEEEMNGVVEQLGSSSQLISFIEEIVDEDIRFLIDAVEEHSDQFVSESSVSDLIDVHGFLAPLIKKRLAGYGPEEFLLFLKQSCIVYKDIAIKVLQCSTNVNSLRGLYTSVANRGEVTKEIIANALQKGVYSVSLKENGICEAKMSYVYEKNEKSQSANYLLPDLHDLRSRAHLIINSDKNALQMASDGHEENNLNINYADFIRQVNLLTEITTLLSKLRLSGYVKYRKFWKRIKGTEDLQVTKDKLQEDLEMWDDILLSAREEYYFLNYYRSDQLCVLHDFLTNRSLENDADVLSLIHFVDPTIRKEQLNEFRKDTTNKQNNSSPDSMVSLIGNALDEIFANTKPVIRPILDDQEELSFSHSKFEGTVKSGELFVACLEKESPLTGNVVLTLYENTLNAFPEPYQIMFCGPQTAWEEIQLVLQRCFSQSEQTKHYSLFCIANVELLANEVQFRLVNEIKEIQNSFDGSKEEDADYRLALICRGGDHHHIVEQFAQYSHHIAGMSDFALSSLLRSRWPEVKMTTSSLPGLGKTERIKREVLAKNMNVVTFTISGPLDQSKLIQRLKKLNLKKYHCLHLDVGEVNDPLLLDTFLFQLIVIGMVSCGTQLFRLLTTHVYIEIANTLKELLRESLVISKYFTRVHLDWENYQDLLVSSEITSDVQVVCQYFDAFEKASLESRDIHFTGPQKVNTLPANRCRQLLTNHYSSDADMTFTALNTFLGVLANQLLKFSRSTFFKIANLKSMLGDEARGVRTNLFRALLEVSKEFASRAITTCRSSNLHALSQKESAEALDKAIASSAMSAQHMVERVEGMIQWEDSNHLLVVFHGVNSQAIAAIYRDKSLVPRNVKNLLNSQMVGRNMKELEDFIGMSQAQLQEKLEKIACTKAVKKSKKPGYTSYALTPDNILKMILIILRVRANAPVIIMGETGCGKTSLVRYLANTCQIKFSAYDFHAGITEEEIVAFILEKEREARECGEQIWVFLDEINTCDHLGLISDVMCHHSLLGRQLSNSLVFLAACNPYKLRPKEQIKTAGLEGKNITDQYSGLVYRVHPLPEAMIDYVWDYGSLAPNDEKAYIRRMVGHTKIAKKSVNLLVDLLAESQTFIRNAECNHFCVSLRDVYRCLLLIDWFLDINQKREEVKNEQNNPGPEHLEIYRVMSEAYSKKPEVKSIVLALAHCYLSRLPTAELRRKYRIRMMTLFSGKGTKMSRKGGVDDFSAIIRMEEEDYLDRMELPPGTARNAALRENVFVMLVCILNRIPVFVVGKPGCSKSLSIQLIRSNVRGRDSKDPLFRSLPQLYVVSYQGSESSTSEGIIKVFEKARKYKSHNEDHGNVLPVVLLDEVGLAENSKYNPLKVLHSLLEPGDGQLPDVAVVGISNWSLDAAKMNRAIHLSRPEPTKDDLYETGHSLLYAELKDEEDVSNDLGSNELRCLAEAYFEYQSTQKHANFHGLRDYYFLIKSLSLSENSDLRQINLALQRNFGGIHGELANIQKIFLDKLRRCMTLSNVEIIPVTQLIQENLADPRARHLMLMTTGDSAIGILKQSLRDLKKEAITIFGSRFEEDLSEEYNYRTLSRIILCMERDCILILRDLESIYGSLYDMLNQNYAVVGKRKNCRVALGAYSNPMCHVNDGFRCIVLTDHHKVDFSDPPFLNRFEKQLLRFSDVLDEEQQSIITELCIWVSQLSTVQGLGSHFQDSDMFIGFHEDTLPSLVLSHSHGTEECSEEIIERCKDDLMWVAAPDGVLRGQKCDRMKEDSQEVKKLSEMYFRKPIHQGFAFFIEAMTRDQEYAFLIGDEIGFKAIVMTFSNIHTDIPKCLRDTITYQVERLSAYKSEKQLAERVNNFWATSDAELLVLQCKPELDGAHLLLARSIIEDKRNSYQQACQDTGLKQKKHVCIVVHVQRGTTAHDVPWQFSFLCGWKQVFLDVLEDTPVSLNEIRTESVQKLLTSSIWPLRRIAQNDLLWCFTCIKYIRNQRPLDSILRIAKSLFSSEKVYQAIEELILQWVKTNGYEEDDITVSSFNESWQVKVACDRQALVNSSTLYGAMEQHVSRLVREPLAKIIFFLEKKNAWPPHVFGLLEDDISKTEYEDIWCDLLLKGEIFDISDIPKPLGAEFYILDSLCLDLQLPFSDVIIRRVDGVKDLFLEDYAQVRENESNLDKIGQLTPNAQQQLIKRYSEVILNSVPEISQFPPACCDSYMDDLFDVTSADFSIKISRCQRVSIIKAAFISHVKQSLRIKDVSHFYVQLHTFVWSHKEHILDLLRMVDCCQPFVNPLALTQLANDFLSRQEFLTNEVHDGSEVEDSREEGDELLHEPKPEEKAPKPEETESMSEDKELKREEKEPKPEEKDPKPEEKEPEPEETEPKPEETEPMSEEKEPKPEEKEPKPEETVPMSEEKEPKPEEKEPKPEEKEPKPEETEPKPEEKEPMCEEKELMLEEKEPKPEEKEPIKQEEKEPKLEEKEPILICSDSEEEIGLPDESEDFQTPQGRRFADIVDEDETNFQNIQHKVRNVDEESEAVKEWNKNCDEELAEEEECFEDILVTVYCEEMLPCTKIVESNNGLASWIRNACLLLSLAFKISDQTPAFHFLRLCVDFAKIFLISSTPQKQALYPLYTLNEIGCALRPEYLDSDESFQKITECLIKHLQQHAKDDSAKHDALQKFSALFYGRCIDTNVDTCGARPIVEQVLSLHRPDLVLLMGPVILRLLLVEEMASPGVFVNLITNPSEIDNCPCLQNIDEVFKSLFTQESFPIHHDSYAAVMICDLIQSLLKFDDNYNIEQMESSDSELCRCVNDAVKVLTEYKQNNCGLVILSAVAFLRAFFSLVSRFVVEKSIVLKTDSSYSLMMNEINSFLSAATAGDVRRLSLRLFFLKQLHQSMSLFDLRKLCLESEMLPSVKKVWENEKSFDKAEFVSVCKLAEYEQVSAAYWKLINKDETEMVTMLGQFQNSSSHRFAVMGVLVNMIYLKRATRNLRDKEELLVNWFSEKINLFHLPFQELLLRIIGRKDFCCPQLQLNPESSVEEVETALLILHISCVIASGIHDEHSPLYQYFSDPSKCTFILAHGQHRMLQAFGNRQPIHGPSPLTCSCGLRIMFEDEQKENKCPSCTESVLPDPINISRSKDGSASNTEEGYSPVPAKELSQWDLCMENLNPAVFRALHLIVHASLYAGFAVGISTKTRLSSLLNIKDNVNSKPGKECQHPAQFCFDHVIADLSGLVTLLDCKKEIAFKVMHLVVEKCTHLMRGHSLGNNSCFSSDQRSKWEIEFSNLAEKILVGALGSSKELKEEIRMPKKTEEEEPAILDLIMELDEYPGEPLEQDQQLKRLFRVTRQPALKNFRATFVNSPNAFQEKYSFLSLFFAKFDELPTIRYLHHLLKWTRLVSSALTHRISRKEAELKSINDFIHGHYLELGRSQDERENHKMLFMDFKKAWNDMRQLVNQELCQQEKEMPRLRETDHIAYCLTESDAGVYLHTAIKILVSMQNAFLDELLRLSALRKHPALGFLETDGSCSGVSSVSVQEVKEKEIINFQWSDELFKFAQNNPEYGHGEEILYDFERIEIELATDLAFGKCHLTGSLNKFIFSKELFHSCGPLLTEMRDLFPQSDNLPEDVRQGLCSLKERRIKEAQDLLQHIEVLIFLLKLKVKTFEENMPLETFAVKWLSMLPSPFPLSLLPPPRSSIKLKHIAAFYEALEDILADGAIDGLPDTFRNDLTEEAKDNLTCLVDKDEGQLKLQTFLNALRRFVFRYLSSEKFLPDETTFLNSCLKETSLWSPDTPPGSQVIPKELRLQNIHSIVTFLQELDKVKCCQSVLLYHITI